VQDWVRKAEAEERADELDDKAEIRRLQKELRRAQQERDILKKAVAFFARDSEDR
jgi:transposase